MTQKQLQSVLSSKQNRATKPWIFNAINDVETFRLRYDAKTWYQKPLEKMYLPWLYLLTKQHARNLMKYFPQTGKQGCNVGFASIASIWQGSCCLQIMCWNSKRKSDKQHIDGQMAITYFLRCTSCDPKQEGQNKNGCPSKLTKSHFPYFSVSTTKTGQQNLSCPPLSIHLRVCERAFITRGPARTTERRRLSQAYSRHTNCHFSKK